MALSVQDFTLAWRRVGNYMNGGSSSAPGLKPAVIQALVALKSYLATQGVPLLPDLQIVPFDELSSAEVVICTDPCKLFAVVLIKDTATATYSKVTDSATTSSDADSEFRIKQSAVDQVIFENPTGQAFANGITMQGNTTPSGGTGSASDGAKGFAIIGRP